MLENIPDWLDWGLVRLLYSLLKDLWSLWRARAARRRAERERAEKKQAPDPDQPS